MYQTFDRLQYHSSWIRRFVSRCFYNYLAHVDRDSQVTLMNYGYVALDGRALPLSLAEEDEPGRYCMQLYYIVSSAVDLHGRDVLEIGSGRGGGASFIKRYLGPRTMTGVDYAKNAVAFCQQRYHIAGLRYLHGDAERLLLPDEQFDAVVNVESSHCYGMMERFLGEVYRVLRPGGSLLWADYRRADRINQVKESMHHSGFRIATEEVISPNVLKAMAIQGQQNRALIDRYVPGIARSTFYHFSGLEGTHIYNQIATGELVYLRMALTKMK